MKNAKIVSFDIEATNLAANFGYMLCFGWKPLGGTARVLDITQHRRFGKDCTNDKYVAAEAKRILDDADVIVSWYGSRFDVPYINTRLVFHGLEPLRPVPHVDAWMIAKYKLKLNSNRLASVAAHLGLEDKTALLGPQWVRAAAGHKPSIRYVVEHCRQDVKVLEEAYLRLRPLTTNHPNVSLIGQEFKAEKEEGVRDCPICGAEGALHRYKWRFVRVGKRMQYQCSKCHGFSQGPVVRAEGVSIT